MWQKVWNNMSCDRLRDRGDRVTEPEEQLSLLSCYLHTAVYSTSSTETYSPVAAYVMLNFHTYVHTVHTYSIFLRIFVM